MEDPNVFGVQEKDKFRQFNTMESRTFGAKGTVRI